MQNQKLCDVLTPSLERFLQDQLTMLTSKIVKWLPGDDEILSNS